MNITAVIQDAVLRSLSTLFNTSFERKDFQINQTKEEFEGDYTIVLFSLVKSLKLSPEKIGNDLGNHLLETNPELFSAFNLIKGFLNLTINDKYWLDLLQKNHNDICFEIGRAHV